MTPTRLTQLVERLHTTACPHEVIAEFGVASDSVTNAPRMRVTGFVGPQVSCRRCVVAAIEAVVVECAAEAAKREHGEAIAFAIRARWSMG